MASYPVKSCEKSYRQRIHSKGMVSFQISVRETDLWVTASQDLTTHGLDLLLECRRGLEDYIASHPVFLKTLVPWEWDPYAPPLVKEMIEATRRAGVGPMASVAGAIAEFVGKGLIKHTSEVIVENGGDVFVSLKRPCNVALLAGSSPLSGLLGLKIPVKQMPAGVCTSSGTVGHSLSYGNADAVCVLARSASYADAAATALANQINNSGDLARLPALAEKMGAVIGVVAIAGEKMVAWGDIELVGL